MIRTFICIELSDALRKEIAGYIDSLRDTGQGVKWIEPENLHITLKFLGDVSEDRVETVVQAVKLTAKDFNPFAMGFSGIGAFPSMKKPNVLWIGVTHGEQELSALASRIDANLSREGFPREKREFRPHLTIGRIKVPKNIDKLHTAISGMKNVDFGEMKVETITVMESRLYRSGPVYCPLEKVCL